MTSGNTEVYANGFSVNSSGENLDYGFSDIQSGIDIYSNDTNALLDSRSKQSDRIIVSIGDSYSSGEGIPPFYGQLDADGNSLPISDKVKSYDWLAHRSMYAWSGMLNLPGVNGTMAENKDEHWYFTAVSGAETVNIKYISESDKVKADKLLKKDKLSKKEEDQLIQYGYQNKTYNLSGKSGNEWIEPQLNIFDKLGNKKADYVTVTIGGNDVGFVDIIKSMVLGNRFLCRSNLDLVLFSALWSIRENGETSKNIESAYKEIEKKAGKEAKIIVAGYPKLFNPGGNLFMIDPFEVNEVNCAVEKFDKAIKRIVDKCNKSGMNIYYVDVIEGFDEHGAYSYAPFINPIIFECQSEDVNQKGLSKFFSAYSMHPNLYGAMTYADCVQKMIDKIEGNDYYGESIVKQYKQEYLKVLIREEKKIKRYDCQYRETGAEPTPIALYDIDGNGIPELFFITQDKPGFSYILNIYTCDSNGARQIYSDVAYDRVVNEHRSFCLVGSRYQSNVFLYSYDSDSYFRERYRIISMSNGDITEESELLHYVDLEGFSDEIYSYDGVDITKDQYELREDLLHYKVKVILYDDQYLREMKRNPIQPSKELAYSYDEAIRELTDGEGIPKKTVSITELKMESKDDYLYKDILDSFNNLVSIGSNQDSDYWMEHKEYEEAFMNVADKDYYYGSPMVFKYDMLGYAFGDITNDGIDELFIIYDDRYYVNNKPSGEYNIASVFTYQDGEIIMLEHGWDRKNLALINDGSLLSDGSDGAYMSIYDNTVFDKSSKSMVIRDRYIFNGNNAHENDRTKEFWYHTDEDEYDRDECYKVKYTEFFEFESKMQSNAVPLRFNSFENYRP